VRETLGLSFAPWLGSVSKSVCSLPPAVPAISASVSASMGTGESGDSPSVVFCRCILGTEG
jgi:hypothetical protein